MMDIHTLRPPAWHRVAVQQIEATRGYGDWQWLIDGEKQRDMFKLRDAGHLAMVHRAIPGGFELLIGAVSPKRTPLFGLQSDARRQERNFRRMG